LAERITPPGSPASSPQGAQVLQTVERDIRVGAAARRQHPVGARRPGTDPWKTSWRPAMALDVGPGSSPRPSARLRVAAQDAGTPKVSWQRRTTRATRCKEHTPRHQRHLLCVANGRVAPTYPPRAATRDSSTTSFPVVERADRTFALDNQHPHRRDRVGRRPAARRRQGCAAHGFRRASTPRCAARSRRPSASGAKRPDWELSLGLPRHRDRAHRSRPVFLDKERLGDGLVLPDPRRLFLRGPRRARPASRRDGKHFRSHPARGVSLPVSDQAPWITSAAEGPCELVMALERDRPCTTAAARQLLRLGAVSCAHDDGQLTGPGMNFDGRPVRRGSATTTRPSRPDVEQRRPSCSPAPTRSAATGPTSGPVSRGEGPARRPSTAQELIERRAAENRDQPLSRASLA